MALRFTLRQLDFFVAVGDAGSIGAEITNVRYWLSADIRRTAPRGPLTAQKQTLANRISEAARFRSGYRSEADVKFLNR